MICSTRILAVSYPKKPLFSSCNSPHSGAGLRHVTVKLESNTRWRLMASDSVPPDSSSFPPSIDSDTSADISAAAAGYSLHRIRFRQRIGISCFCNDFSQTINSSCSLNECLIEFDGRSRFLGFPWFADFASQKDRRQCKTLPTWSGKKFKITFGAVETKSFCIWRR